MPFRRAPPLGHTNINTERAQEFALFFMQIVEELADHVRVAFRGLAVRGGVKRIGVADKHLRRFRFQPWPVNRFL